MTEDVLSSRNLILEVGNWKGIWMWELRHRTFLIHFNFLDAYKSLDVDITFFIIIEWNLYEFHWIDSETY